MEIDYTEILKSEFMAEKIPLSEMIGGDFSVLRNTEWQQRSYGVHYGIDIPMKVGTPIYALGTCVLTNIAWDPYVKKNGKWTGGGGHIVYLKYPRSGLKFTLMHLKFASPDKIGTEYGPGDIVAYSGNTGHSSGPHLHLEINSGSKKIKPSKIFDYAK